MLGLFKIGMCYRDQHIFIWELLGFKQLFKVQLWQIKKKKKMTILF